MHNRMHNSGNRFQGQYKKVLCVCSAGLLRSPSLAVVLSQEPYNYNTRAAGIEADYALVPVDEVLVMWADEIVCVEPSVTERLWSKFGDDLDSYSTKIKTLNIPDNFEYRNPELMNIIRQQYEEVT